MKEVTLGVKVNAPVAAVFQQWARSNGMTSSQALGMFIECVMKMQHGKAIMNEKLQNLMQMWDKFQDIDKVGNVISPSAKLEVLECIYFVQEEGKRCTTPILVEPSYFDEPIYNTNLDEILDEVLHSCCRGLHRRLKELAKRFGTTGMIDTINAVCDYFCNAEDDVHNEIIDMFSDNTRHDWGKDTEFIKYKRHNRKTINEAVQLTLFDNLQDHEQGQELSLTKPSQREGCYNDNYYEQGQELPEDNQQQEVAEPEQEDEADE